MFLKNKKATQNWQLSGKNENCLTLEKTSLKVFLDLVIQCVLSKSIYLFRVGIFHLKEGFLSFRTLGYLPSAFKELFIYLSH
jgi:hypothetical protein